MDPDYDPLAAAMRVGPEIANPAAPPPDYDPLDAARKLNAQPILSTSHTTLPRDANGGVGIPWTNPEEAFQEDYAKHPAGLPTVADLREVLKPEPGWVHSSILPLATKETSPGQGDINAGAKWDWGPVRPVGNAVLDLLEGTGQATSVGGPDAPLAGKVSPEATLLMLGQMLRPGNPLASRPSPPAAGDLRFGGGWTPPSGFDARNAPLPPDFKANPVAPAAGLLAPADGPVTPTGIPVRPQPAPPAPIAPPPEPMPVPPATNLGPVQNAKAVASAYFDIAHKNNSEISPGYMNKFFDNATSGLDRQTPQGIATAGPDAVTQLMNRWNTDLRNQPSTLHGVTEMDRHLGSLITQEYGPTGISDIGRQLQTVQRNLRDHIESAGPDDVTGGAAGIDALQPGRKAWSQALKMDDIIRMQERADRTQNPTQSIKTQANTLLSSRTKSRGWSDEEKAALETASERGVIGSVFYGLGSRLMSKAGAAAGASIGGLPGMAIGYGIGEGGSAIARGIANRISANRIQQALDVLNKSVPPPPGQ